MLALVLGIVAVVLLRVVLADLLAGGWSDGGPAGEAGSEGASCRQG